MQRGRDMRRDMSGLLVRFPLVVRIAFVRIGAGAATCSAWSLASVPCIRATPHATRCARGLGVGGAGGVGRAVPPCPVGRHAARAERKPERGGSAREPVKVPASIWASSSSPPVPSRFEDPKSESLTTPAHHARFMVQRAEGIKGMQGHAEP